MLCSKEHASVMEYSLKNYQPVRFPVLLLLFSNLILDFCRFKSSPVNTIFCQALAGSPLRPQRLAQLDKEHEEQLKPPFSATTEIREVRYAQN